MDRSLPGGQQMMFVETNRAYTRAELGGSTE